MANLSELQHRLALIQEQLDRREYRAGLWQRLVGDVRRLPGSHRAAMAADIARLSDKLHHYNHPKLVTMSFGRAVVLEVLLTAAGAALLIVALAAGSNAAAVAAAIIWIVTLQPLLKIAVGSILGVRYSYAYLYSIEPRFKMSYGSYLVAPRWARVALHLSGTIGSPLGAALVWIAVRPALPLAASVSAILFWLTLANLSTFIIGLLGVRKFGRVPLWMSSGGAAAVELLEG